MKLKKIKKVTIIILITCLLISIYSYDTIRSKYNFNIRVPGAYLKEIVALPMEYSEEINDFFMQGINFYVTFKLNNNIDINKIKVNLIYKDKASQLFGSGSGYNVKGFEEIYKSQKYTVYKTEFSEGGSTLSKVDIDTILNNLEDYVEVRIDYNY